MDKTLIQNENHSEERAFYGQSDLAFYNCHFEGEEDGESALKEASNLQIDFCCFALRYPLWHVDNAVINDSRFVDTCRAPIWYAKNIEMNRSFLYGPKAVRESSKLKFTDSFIYSAEFGWRSVDLSFERTTVDGEYAFFQAANIKADFLTFKGKYSFQYVNKASITNSTFDTKDAFWHSKNITIKNSVIKGEYIGWYSKNLTLINCVIDSHQPFCYCEGLKLVDCKMPNCDLAFEYSDVEATIVGRINSIKNPRSGYIDVDEIGEQIFTPDSKFESTTNIREKGKYKWQYFGIPIK